MTKSFVALAIIAAFLGVSWGGAFIGGIVYGEYRSDGAVSLAAPRAPGGGEFTRAARSGDGAGSLGGTVGQSRQGGSGGGEVQDGGTGNAVFARQEGRNGRLGAGGDSRSSGDEARGPATPLGMARGGVLKGRVEAVEEGNVTIATESGTVSAVVSEETVIVTVREAGIDDLSEGVQVVVMGRRAEEGLAARALLLNPDGVDVSFLGGRSLETGEPSRGR